MSYCTILEDLKVLEEDLDARQDILKAIEDHRDTFNSKNNSLQPSRFGMRIKPASPKFHANFPSKIEVSPNSFDDELVGFDNEDWLRKQASRTGTYMIDVYFHIVPANLNCYPVWDNKLKKFTNGRENNDAFSITRHQVSEWYYSPSGYVFEDGIVADYRADPDNPKWLTWYWNDLPFDINKHIHHSVRINSNIKCDPQTGLVTGKIVTTSLGPETVVPMDLTLNVHNGNGEASKAITLMISPKGGLSGELDQEFILMTSPY